MKIAFLSDIHSNLEALTVALEEIERCGVDRLICLGDIVGYGANPVECLELVQSKTSDIILGNHDAAAANIQDLAYFNDFARAAALWTMSIISDEQKEFIRSLPYEIKENDLHLVHGTPGEPERWHYIFSEYDASSQFDAIDGRICLVGHSHVPGDYREKNPVENAPAKRIINIGSVGQPRDRDPRLCFVIYDTETDEVEFIRQEYDIEAAAGKIRRAGLPEFLADRLLWGW